MIPPSRGLRFDQAGAAAERAVADVVPLYPPLTLPHNARRPRFPRPNTLTGRGAQPFFARTCTLCALDSDSVRPALYLASSPARVGVASCAVARLIRSSS